MIQAGEGQEEEEELPPQGEDDCSDFSYDSEGFLNVAGDGACPDGQGDLRLSGSGAGVHYGRGSKHNSVIQVKGTAQGAQRGEVRAALRSALWAWSKTVYITDSQQVKDGIKAILQGKKEEAEITQRPLEENCSSIACKRLGETQSCKSPGTRETTKT